MSNENKYDYDLFVIGGGSGGVRAARMVASEGRRVAIAEDTHWGGTCVNVGCVPKKLFVYASHFSHDFKDAEAFGWNVSETTFDWQTLIDNKNKEIERLNGIYVRLLGNAGVTLLDGRARILGPNTVEVSGTEYSVKTILIAVGGTPFIPEFKGSEHAIDSNDAFYLESFPDEICIVGGGFIACEFACIFKGLGAKVTLIYRGEEILRGFDDDLRTRVHQEMTKQGIDVRVNEDVDRIEVDAENRRQVSLKTGDSLRVDQVFYATGRIPRTQDLWADSVDINTGRSGAIEVDSHFQTSVPSIYALGDVVGRMALTPVATAEAMAFTQHIVNDVEVTLDYANIPSAVFTTPNLATVGLTGAQAREKGIDFAVYQADFKHLKHTLTQRDERVYMKLMVNKADDRVIGAHMMGPDAGEVIQLAAVAIKAGATKAHFDETIGIHPSMAEEFVTMRTPLDE